ILIGMKRRAGYSIFAHSRALPSEVFYLFIINKFMNIGKIKPLKYYIPPSLELIHHFEQRILEK
ncbi:MAG: hypothetical protein AABY50_04680, partial [Nitrospirota bacterium]